MAEAIAGAVAQAAEPLAAQGADAPAVRLTLEGAFAALLAGAP